ncbi:hypothetical protein [Pseudomonas chlororaphis]|uniref:hypothetical protein n=1 Tax=Pseudomonas chlororaphis TaxID=587753 RepID=UPI00240850B7|nr:hypothetical protein [Pseudomonas chlororaphis]
MPEQKHTPGPWYTHRNGFSTVYVEARLRQGVIQEVAACGPTEAGQEQQEANAKLIAAAPELLEALIEVTASLAWNAHGECRAIHEGPIMPSSGAVEMARAAIAKATS